MGWVVDGFIEFLSILTKCVNQKIIRTSEGKTPKNFQTPMPHHILSASQIKSKSHLLQFLQRAKFLKNLVEKEDHNTLLSLLRGKTLANVFMEPSTRTQLSFQNAFQRLCGHVLSITDPSVTSISKGETLEDTVKVLQQYSDVIVMRHGTKGSLARAASVATVPVINAGDGIGEHPTQALLDILTAVRFVV